MVFFFFYECSVDVLVSFEQGRIENGLMGLINLLGFWGFLDGCLRWDLLAHSRVCAVRTVHIKGF